MWPPAADLSPRASRHDALQHRDVKRQIGVHLFRCRLSPSSCSRRLSYGSATPTYEAPHRKNVMSATLWRRLTSQIGVPRPAAPKCKRFGPRCSASASASWDLLRASRWAIPSLPPDPGTGAQVRGASMVFEPLALTGLLLECREPAFVPSPRPLALGGDHLVTTAPERKTGRRSLGGPSRCFSRTCRCRDGGIRTRDPLNPIPISAR